MKNYSRNIVFACLFLLALNQVYAEPTESEKAEANIEQEIVQEQINNDKEFTNVEKIQEVKVDNQIKDNNVCKENPILIRGFDHYKGSCLNGLANGQGIAEGSRGIYEGHFENGAFNGQGVLTSFLDGQKYHGNFINGQRHGEFKTLDTLSGYTRLALFENDQFIKWIDDVNAYEDVNYQTTSYDTNTSSNYTPSSITTISNNVNKETVQQPYIGMQTRYGTVVAITANTFTAESRITGSDGYSKIKTTQYPLYLLK